MKDRFFTSVLAGLLLLLGADDLFAQVSAQSPSLPDTLSFDRAAELLVAHNPRLRAARSRGRARVGSARDAARYPNPSFGLSEERTNLAGGGVDDQWYTSLRQQIEYPGETRARRRGADAVERAAEATVKEAGADLYRELRRRYVSVVEARARRNVLARLTEAVRRAAKAARVRAEEGDMGTFQRSRLQVARATYENDLADAERELHAARAELAYMILPDRDGPDRRTTVESLGPEHLPAVTGEMEFAPVEVEADLALERALANRGRMIAARARLESEARTLEATRYRRYPNLTVSAGPKRQSVPGGATFGYTAGITVELPVWNDGDQAVRAQQGRQEAAAAELETARRTVELEVSDALHRVESYRGRIESLSGQIETGAEALRADALFVYEEGEISLFELLDALDAARQSALLRTRLTAEHLRGLYDLAFALGVGPEDAPLLVDGALRPRDPALSN